MRIKTGRTLFGVQYKLRSDGFQCVAYWFTDSGEALAQADTLRKLPDAYKDVWVVTVRLPDTVSDLQFTVTDY